MKNQFENDTIRDQNGKVTTDTHKNLEIIMEYKNCTP